MLAKACEGSGNVLEEIHETRLSRHGLKGHATARLPIWLKRFASYALRTIEIEMKMHQKKLMETPWGVNRGQDGKFTDADAIRESKAIAQQRLVCLVTTLDEVRHFLELQPDHESEACPAPFSKMSQAEIDEKIFCTSEKSVVMQLFQKFESILPMLEVDRKGNQIKDPEERLEAWGDVMMRLLEDVLHRKPRKCPVKAKQKVEGEGGNSEQDASGLNDDAEEAAQAEREKNFYRAEMQKSLANFRDICYCASLHSRAIAASSVSTSAPTSIDSATDVVVDSNSEKSNKPVVPAEPSEPTIDPGLLACVSHALTLVGSSRNFFSVNLNAYKPVESSPMVVRRDEVCAEYLKEVVPENHAAENVKECPKRKSKKGSLKRESGKENNPADGYRTSAVPIKLEKTAAVLVSNKDVEMAGGVSTNEDVKMKILEQPKDETNLIVEDQNMACALEDGVERDHKKVEVNMRPVEEAMSTGGVQARSTMPDSTKKKITGFFTRVATPAAEKTASPTKRRKLSEGVDQARSAHVHALSVPPTALDVASLTDQTLKTSHLAKDAAKLKMESQPKCEAEMAFSEQSKQSGPKNEEAACVENLNSDEGLRQKRFCVKQVRPLAGDDQDEVVYNVTKKFDPSFLVWRLLDWWDQNCEGNESSSLLLSVMQPDPLALFKVAENKQKVTYKRLAGMMKPENGALRGRSQTQKTFSFLSGRKAANPKCDEGRSMLELLLGHGGTLDPLYQCSSIKPVANNELSFLSSTICGPELDDAMAFLSSFEASEDIPEEKNQECARQANHEVPVFLPLLLC
jgi:hypothetical protein